MWNALKVLAGLIVGALVGSLFEPFVSGAARVFGYDAERAGQAAATAMRDFPYANYLDLAGNVMLVISMVLGAMAGVLLVQMRIRIERVQRRLQDMRDSLRGE